MQRGDPNPSRGAVVAQVTLSLSLSLASLPLALSLSLAPSLFLLSRVRVPGAPCDKNLDVSFLAAPSHTRGPDRSTLRALEMKINTIFGPPPPPRLPRVPLFFFSPHTKCGDI